MAPPGGKAAFPICPACDARALKAGIAAETITAYTLYVSAAAGLLWIEGASDYRPRAFLLRGRFRACDMPNLRCPASSNCVFKFAFLVVAARRQAADRLQRSEGSHQPARVILIVNGSTAEGPKYLPTTVIVRTTDPLFSPPTPTQSIVSVKSNVVPSSNCGGFVALIIGYLHFSPASVACFTAALMIGFFDNVLRIVFSLDRATPQNPQDYHVEEAADLKRSVSRRAT
jgi:hypothetical protein